jgi:hypothetical protein
MTLPVLQSGGFGLSQPMQAAITALVDALLGGIAITTLGAVNITTPAGQALVIASGASGNLDNMVIGNISPSTVKATRYRASSIPDATGTPGAATQNAPAGKAAIVAGQSAVVITNTNCATTSVVQLTPISGDATMKSLRVTVAAGSFTVTGDVACTAAFLFGWTLMAV